MRIVVDLNRCQAYAQCCLLATGVFQLHGEEALFYDPAPDEEQREQVLRAAAACPVQAIFPADELPEKWKFYTEVNKNFFPEKDEAKAWAGHTTPPEKTFSIAETPMPAPLR